MNFKFMRFMLILAGFAGILAANDNPFAPPQNIDESANLQDFEKKDVVFNSDARVLKRLTLTYITLDGSEKSVDLDINQSIDWHRTYIFAKTKVPQGAEMLDVSVTVPEHFNLSGEKNATMNVEIPNDNGKIAEFLSFASYKNKIKLITQDEIIGNFALGNPSKIIIDFKREASFATKSLRVKNSAAFKRLQIGSHKGYYRLVIYLDGKYSYKIERDESGYVVFLK